MVNAVRLWDVKVFTREDNADLSAGVDMMVRVSSSAAAARSPRAIRWLAVTGTRGVVSRVVAVEDMHSWMRARRRILS